MFLLDRRVEKRSHRLSRGGADGTREGVAHLAVRLCAAAAAIVRAAEVHEPGDVDAWSVDVTRAGPSGRIGSIAGLAVIGEGLPEHESSSSRIGAPYRSEDRSGSSE
jgi:hypothetical protein